MSIITEFDNNIFDLLNESLKIVPFYYSYPQEFNIIPATIYLDTKQNNIIKRPKGNWKKYQTEKYPKEELNGENPLCVVCGKISNNLLVIDFDIPKGKYATEQETNDIYNRIIKRHPKLKECNYIVRTMRGGLHFYFFLESIDVYENLGEQEINIKAQKTGLKTDIEGISEIDLRCEGNIVLTYPSEYKDKKYELWLKNEAFTPSKITNMEFLEILKSITITTITKIKKETKLTIGSINTLIPTKIDNKFKKLRTPFKDIFNSFIELDSYAKTTKQPEKNYWRGSYFEGERVGISFEETAKILSKSQKKEFDWTKTKDQIKDIKKRHDEFEGYYKSWFCTKKGWEAHFPNYPYEKFPTTTKKQPKKKKKLSKEEIKKCEEWLKLPDNKKIEEIHHILAFNIIGEKERNKGLLIFLLKLGDILQKELISFVSIKGEPSVGKSHICDNALKLLPEDKIYIIDSGSDKALHYDELLKGKRVIYIREMKKNLNLIEELKSTYDYNPIIKTVEKNTEGQFITRTIQNEQMGLLSTYSFEFTQRDLINRSWILTPDQAYQQTERIINFEIQKQENKIKRDITELEINKRRKFIQNALSLLDNNLIPYIPYAKQLKPLFSKKNLRIRRDVSKIYDLIGIITLFNQKNRKILEIKETGKKYIFSEYNDLSITLKIAKEYFLEITQDLDRIKKDILDFMTMKGMKVYDKEKVDNVSYRNYVIKDISKKISIDNSVHNQTIRRKLESLSYDGYIEILSKGKGKATKYKKLKGYDELDIKLDDIKDDIDELVKKEYDNYLNKG